MKTLIETKRSPFSFSRPCSRRTISVAVSAAMLLLVSACGTPYVAKANGPHANLRMITDDGNPTDFTYVADATVCPEKKFVLASLYDLIPGKKSEIKMPGSLPTADRKVSETVIEAERPFIMDAGSRVPSSPGFRGYMCNVRLQFTPEQGADYEIHYSLKYKSSDVSCKVALNKLVSTGGAGYSEVPVKAERMYRTCYKY